MSPEQQKEIVTNLCNTIRDATLKRIDNCDVPEEWDGIELKQLLAEMFWFERGFSIGSGHHPRSKRVKDYRNAVITLNLDR